MLAALGLDLADGFVRRLFRGAFHLASTRLGRVLARFDRLVARDGACIAAAATLDELGVAWKRQGDVPKRGSALVVSNHPGAYDALLLVASIDRTDVVIVAADRPFLRALPELAKKLILISDTTASRAAGARRAHRHLARGGALVHFGAGVIEPDPAFATHAVTSPLAMWRSGAGMLVRSAARAGGSVTTAIVSGVHSPRAKALLVTRLCEQRGVTTMAPLLQVALPGCRDVFAQVCFGDAVDAALLANGDGDESIAGNLRASALELLAAPPSRAAPNGDSSTSARLPWRKGDRYSGDGLTK
jgi:hypothetical protein